MTRCPPRHSPANQIWCEANDNLQHDDLSPPAPARAGQPSRNAHQASERPARRPSLRRARPPGRSRRGTDCTPHRDLPTDRPPPAMGVGGELGQGDDPADSASSSKAQRGTRKQLPSRMTGSPSRPRSSRTDRPCRTPSSCRCGAARPPPRPCTPTALRRVRIGRTGRDRTAPDTPRRHRRRTSSC